MSFAESSSKELAYSKALLRTLSFAGVQFVRVLAIDCGNNVRCKAIPIDQLRRKGDSIEHAVSIAEVSVGGMPSYADSVQPASGLDTRYSLLLKPDLSTLRILPYAPQSALMMTTLEDPRTGKPSDLCCRSLLARVIQYAADKYELAFSVGAEIEFCLYKADTNQPVDHTNFCDTFLLNQLQEFVNSLYEQLKSQDIEIELIHSESSHGQMEIVLAYQKDVMVLADHLVLARETLQQVARAHGLKAVFLPKFHPQQAGNGCHLHISFCDVKSGENLVSQPMSASQQVPSADFLEGSVEDIRAAARSFMEGILKHLPALLALTLPTVNSFRRVGPGCWTGSSVSWDFEDKEAPLRVVSDGSTWNRFEFKLCDAEANIHLALASVLRAGLHGLEQSLRLRPSRLQQYIDDQESLPATVLESLECLETDELLCEFLSPKLIKAYLGIRRAEAARASTMSLEDEVAEVLAKA